MALTVEIPGYGELSEVHRGHRYLVLRGRRLSTGATVVLKTVVPGPSAAEHAQSLRREFVILGALAGMPGVVRALALEGPTDAPVMVLADAGPLHLEEWLKHRRLEPPTFLPLAARLAEILAAVHARSVIHRDINPCNVVLDPLGDPPIVTLVDFHAATTIISGAAGAEDSREAITGTLTYLAPEQTGRLGRVVDQRADLYALGVTFYEMLTGAPPFKATDPVELIHAHLARPPVPPATLDARIPPLLSDLVLKLLAKMPEERYQSAAAVAADLRQAQAAWRSSGQVPPFDLGRGDLVQSLPIPDRLYGRQRELAELLAASERVTVGASELLVVTGPAGIGKTALVFGLARQMEEGFQRGHFEWGKFQPLRDDFPYAPLVEALRRLCRGWLEGPAPARQEWRALLREALGRNAGVMTGLVPELGEVLGEVPAIPDLGPLESERRFQLTFSALVRALAHKLRPLVLLIDDLHWADAGSLELLERLATDPDIRHLLLVVTYRPEEVSAEHPVARFLEAVRAGGGRVGPVLALAPLDEEAITAVCRDTLHREGGEVGLLGRQVRQKTGGNAFFVRRFLLHLHQAGLLRWSAERGRWEWDAEAIARAEVTENVLGLMLAAIRRLPTPTRRLLEIASCLRRGVDLGLLAAVAGRPLEDVVGELWPALQEGLLVPEPGGGAPAPERPGNARYRFVHDRVQQAAYSLLDEEGRARLHLTIARHLLAERGKAGAAASEAALFELVDQLRPAVPLLERESEPERLRLLEIAFLAGRRAQATSAYAPALACFDLALALAPPGFGERQPALAFQLHRQALQVAELTGDTRRAAELAPAAFALARTPLEAAELHNIALVAGSMRGAYREMIEEGKVALRLLGVELPGPGDSAGGAPPAGVDVHARLGGRKPEQLLDLPRLRDPLQLARMQLLANLLDPAYVCDPALLGVLVERLVELSLAHGNSVHSAFAYTVYAMLVAVREADFATSHALGRTGVELARRFGDPVQECRTLHIFATFVNHWRAPVASGLPRLRQAVSRALESGDLHYGAYADYTAVAVAWHRGVELGQIARDLEDAFALARKIRVNASQAYLVAFRQALRCLQGRTRGRGQLDDDAFDEAAHLAASAANPIALWFHHVLRLQTAYLLRDTPTARLWSQRAAAVRPLVGPVVSVVDHTFYTSLTLAAELAQPASPDRTATLGRIEENQRELAAWAASCPENFRHKHELVTAELCRLGGDDAAATQHYDAAIDGAQRGGFLCDLALGSELAGRHQRALGRRRIADFYLREAVEGYARWGGADKAAALEEEFSHLAELPWRSPLPTIGADGKALDLLSLVKAAGTISSEVVLERLIERLLAICFEVGGADRGALVLEEEGRLMVRAHGAVTGALALGRTPLAESEGVPRSLIEQAHGQAEPVVLGDVTRPPPVAVEAAAYLRERQVKSALALPIRHHARSVGVLYLENTLAAHTFTAARLKVLDLLSSQMAISLENSLLFGRLSQEIEERKRAEAKAQDSVRSRDEFLSIASHELKTPITSLSLAMQVLVQDAQQGTSARQRQLTEVAARQVRRLHTLVEDLLDVSRIRAGRLTLTYENVELGALVRETLEGFSAELTEARCAVEVRASEPVVGQWSRGRLEQVVTNLISNALKFGRGKPITIEVARTGDQASLSVTDQGIGIPSDRLPFIFERFERAVSPAHYGGLGLGLYIAREIVSVLGGSIQAHSQLGQGSTFTVTLPLAVPREQTSALFAPVEAAPSRGVGEGA